MHLWINVYHASCLISFMKINAYRIVLKAITMIIIRSYAYIASLIVKNVKDPRKTNAYNVLIHII